MKLFRCVSALALAAALFGFAGCGAKVYKAGTYSGEGQGHGGMIKVAVTVDAKAITGIEVTENPESEFSLPAIEKLIKRAMEANGGKIDAVSGASETSGGVIAAIEGALAQARLGDAVAGKAAAAKKTAKNLKIDIAVIGSGGAGISAAIAAKNAGASVVIIEKMAVVGGNSNYATGGLNAAETVYQKEKEIPDSIELFIEDTMKGGKNLNDPDLVRTLAEKSAATVDWLTSLGADLSDVGRMAGASVNRTHRPAGGKAVGEHLVSTLHKAALAAGIEVRTENKAVALTQKNGRVTGVKVSSPEGDYTISAKAVIIATGGFGASQEKVVQYKSDLAGFGTTNHPGATGDALDLVSGLNAALVDMEQIQTHPTVVPKNNTMITEAVRGNGAILVNREGVRFVSELETRDVVSEATLAQTGKTAFLLFDEGVRKSLAAIESYAKSGLLSDGETLEAAAAKVGVDGAALKTTVAKYNGFVAAKKDSDFARADLPRALSTGPYYLVEVGPAVHHTMGGLKIDTQARVIDQAGAPIPGLYAAGEVTGGVHGANRLGGNAVADITVFGRIAGESAAKGL